MKHSDYTGGRLSKSSRTEKKIGILDSVLEREARENPLWDTVNIIRVFLPCFPPTAQEKEGPGQERRGKHSMVSELNLKFVSLDFLGTFR